VNFEEGKLYKCSKHLLMIYPTREIAATLEVAAAAFGAATRASPASMAAAAFAAMTRASSAVWAASYWSKELNCTVRYSEQNEIFIFIKEEIIEEQKYLNVLFGDKQGWIVYKDWMEIERVL